MTATETFYEQHTGKGCDSTCRQPSLWEQQPPSFQIATFTCAPLTRVAATSMIERHYLGRWPGVVRLVLGLWSDGQPIGVIVLAEPPRETKKRYGGETWELARLWVDDRAPRNSESWFISRAIRWVRHHHSDVRFLVSYADPSAGHQGIIYRAANWKIDGRTDQERKTPRFDYVDEAGKVYSRRSHVPVGVPVTHKPRVSKYRYYYEITEKR